MIGYYPISIYLQVATEYLRKHWGGPNLQIFVQFLQKFRKKITFMDIVGALGKNPENITQNYALLLYIR